jgi:2-oxo-4-hydroxy-4-carboxy--5-ureidoimidazoline (OHCU) decarboxylase
LEVQRFRVAAGLVQCCATGLTGDQMLAALEERLRHNEEMERTVAAAELRKITRLRVAKELVL